MTTMKRAGWLASAALVAFATAASAQTTQQRINALVARGISGRALQSRVIDRSWGIMGWNRPYVGDGVKDCYGYVRQVWNAILSDGSTHSEDYRYYNYTVARKWINLAGGIPVNTFPDGNWASISSLGGIGNLLPGDIIGTNQGHMWGFSVHYAMYAGGYKIFQDGGGYNGAYYTPYNYRLIWYYKPLHAALAANSTPVTVTDNSIYVMYRLKLGIGLNIHNGPGWNHSIAGTLPAGTIVDVYGFVGGGSTGLTTSWLKIWYAGGWRYLANLKTVKFGLSVQATADLDVHTGSGVAGRLPKNAIVHCWQWSNGWYRIWWNGAWRWIWFAATRQA